MSMSRSLSRHHGLTLDEVDNILNTWNLRGPQRPADAPGRDRSIAWW
jgi:hypothetical protein